MIAQTACTSQKSSLSLPMKATQTQIQSAYDSFTWTLQNATGGTRDENRNGYFHNLQSVERKAAAVAALAANPNKVAAANTWLMEACANIPNRIQRFKEQYAPLILLTEADAPLQEGIRAFAYAGYPAPHPYRAFMVDIETGERIGLTNCPSLDSAENVCKKWMGLIPNTLAFSIVR